jgi:uncharacterized protein YuzB (UPF0349 family)
VRDNMSNILKSFINTDKELDKAELNEGERHCDICSGVGILKEYSAVNFCPKCKGTGKLDWIENILGKQNKNPSALDNINVRHLVNYVQKEIENSVKDLQFELNDDKNMKIVEYNVISMLDNLKCKNALVDYETIVMPTENKIIVNLKPNKISEIIKLNIKLT